MPAFLVAWGSGQNALLTYLMIPFIKILGLNVLSVRLPMAILGCISLVIMYLLLNKISNKKIATIGLTFFAICPWHIMKSRWGLESNLFPDLILIFTYLLVKGLEDKNKILYYLSFAIAGITAYAYGTSYYFLPVFIIPLLIMLVKKQKITIKQAIISIAIVGLVSLPIILYVIVNTLNLNQINLPFVTIPKLEVNRYKELTAIFSSDFFTSSMSNFIESMKILITQTDGLPWNSIYPFGTIYIFSTVFTIIGLINSFRNEKMIEIKYDFIFNIWFIVSIILTFICEPNINRLNIIMIPIIYYTIIGIYLVVNNKKKVALGIVILYVISFGLFMYKYLNENCDEYGTFESDLEEVIQYVDGIQNKEIYITNKIKSSYMYTLFYTQFDTREFVETVEYENKYVEFREVNSFGKYHFQEIKDIETEERIYVIRKEDREKYDLEYYKITEFEKYIVIE
ncbi:MAG: glycosyltransferase family 39 protein [Clostridia bacterium]|nr:glycosyltransferase family 39 protein [Clostridia bacterium]